MLRHVHEACIALVVLSLVLVGPTDRGIAQQNESITISLVDADMTLVGEDAGDWAGYFASPAGDVNGDGLGDLLVGAPMAGEKVCPYPVAPGEPCPGLPKGQGVAYLVLGRPKDEWLPNPISLGGADASFLGCEVNSMTARQLYTAGDVNGDGYDDILISGWKCGPDFTGKAYLFLGRPDVGSWGHDFPVEQADASFLGENTWDFLSYYVSTAGDVDADGYDDFLITSTHYDITGTQVVTNTGKVYLIMGREDADWGADFPLAQADATFLGEAEEDRIGRSVAGIGDVNADGYDDFLIGSISSDYNGVDAGQNYLFLGRARPGDPGYDPAHPWWGLDYSVAGADASFVGESAGDESGRRVAKAGDVNGDGYGDFLMGSALNDQAAPDAGIAHLILGRAAADWGMHYPLAQADASFIGETARDQAGRRLNGAGDVNGDGYADFLIGAPHNEQGGLLAGAAYLIYGRSAADWGSYYPLSRADITYVGKADVGAAGYDVGWLDDFNGDGVDDYLIAAYGGRNNDEVPGEVYVLLGTGDAWPVQFLPDVPRNYLGWRRFTGDYIDPDGWQDIGTVQLVLGRDVTDSTGLNVKYEATENGLYLYDGNQSTWLGPCTPGEETILSNGVVQLDCRGSTVETRQLWIRRAMWRARWLQPMSGSAEIRAYLRGTDLSANDSGFAAFQWHQDVAIMTEVSPVAGIFPSGPMTYTVTFGNAGGTAAANVVITDILPSELIDIHITSSHPVTATGTMPYTWSAGDLAPMEGGVITIAGRASSGLPSGYVFTNTAMIAATQPDDDRNNIASVRAAVSHSVYLPLVLN